MQDSVITLVIVVLVCGPIVLGLPYLMYLRDKSIKKLRAEKRASKKRESAEAKRQRQETERRQAEEEKHRAEQDARDRQEQSRRQAEDSRRAQDEHQARTSNDEPGYASVLGLKGKVKPEDVRKRYRELAAQYHPDKVSHLGAKELLLNNLYT